MYKNSFFFALVFLSFSSQAEYTENVHYVVMDHSASSYVEGISDEILVIETFWYGCPHCYKFEVHINEWKKTIPKDVKLERVPAVFNKIWALHAKVYFTLKTIDKLDIYHQKFFIAIHEQNRNFKDLDSISNFFENQGMDINNFRKVFLSDKITKKVKNANYMLEEYSIDSVPQIIINNKYKISGKMAKSYKGMIKIMNFLIKKERGLRANL